MKTTEKRSDYRTYRSDDVEAIIKQLAAATELLRRLSDWYNSDDAECGELPKDVVFDARKWLAANDPKGGAE